MRRLLIPGGILVAFLLIWIIQSKVEKSEMSGKTIENFLKLDPSQVDRIILQQSQNRYEFELNDGRWYLRDSRNRPADSMAIKSLLTAAAEMKVGTIVSQNPERQQEFMVDSLNGNLAQFYTGERLLSQIIIGKMSPDFSSSYVRIPGSSEVYLAAGQLSFNFSRQRSQWLDRTILSLKPENINEVEFIYPDRAYRIKRDSTRWLVAKKPYADAVEADSMKTAAFVNRLSRLSASEFPTADESGSVSFQAPLLTVRVTSADSLYQLEFASSRQDSLRFFCRRVEPDDTLIVSKANFESLRKDFASFLPD
ncbi:MAG: DUF4340 domain-containing protein [bacterium]|jgi:hypothetical protein